MDSEGARPDGTSERKIMSEKIVSFILCLFGISAVSYGMIKENHLIFIVGLPFMIGGYLLIRKQLKATIRNKS